MTNPMDIGKVLTGKIERENFDESFAVCQSKIRQTVTLWHILM